MAPCCHRELAGADNFLATCVFFEDCASCFGSRHASLTGADHMVSGSTSSSEILRGVADGQVLFTGGSAPSKACHLRIWSCPCYKCRMATLQVRAMHILVSSRTFYLDCLLCLP